MMLGAVISTSGTHILGPSFRKFLSHRNLFYLPKIYSFNVKPKQFAEIGYQFTNQRSLSGYNDGTGGTSHSHQITWIFEKVATGAMVLCIPSLIIYPSFGLDVVTSTIIAIHHYLGIKNILEDYARQTVTGKFISKLSHWLNVFSAGIALIGFVLFSKNQMCLGDAVQRLWRIEFKNKPMSDE